MLLGQATVHEFIRRGSFEPNLERVIGLLRARRDAMFAALDRHLPGARASRPEGGYFLWLELDGVDARELLPRAEAAGVTFVQGTDFGGPEHASPRLQLRDAGRDRGGRRPPRLGRTRYGLAAPFAAWPGRRRKR